MENPVTYCSRKHLAAVHACVLGRDVWGGGGGAGTGGLLLVGLCSKARVLVEVVARRDFASEHGKTVQPHSPLPRRKWFPSGSPEREEEGGERAGRRMGKVLHSGRTHMSSRFVS